ncbi:MAG: TIGR00730 family Rossman fold protein [Muribaculaceae bacterium]|nr:TIGR00730 family Rossman fold protein [Muribaculaceae bacterium]
MNRPTTVQRTLAVTIYCGSTPGVDKVYTDAAYTLGLEAARRGIATVTGAGCNGLMGAVVDGTLDGAGTAIGVIPSFMVERGWHNTRMSRLHVTEGMHPRKHMMADLSIGAIALPGGVGTLDELFEIITWHQLGIYPYPVVILNIAGYYDPLLEMLSQAASSGMLRNAQAQSLWHEAKTPQEALDHILSNQPDLRQ